MRARLLPTLVLWLTPLLAAGTLPPAARATEPLGAALLWVGEAASPPADEAPWRPVTLPDRWARRAPDFRGEAWYRMRFELDAKPTEPWLLYLPVLRDGGRIFLNGQFIATVREADAAHYVRWLKPHAFPMPPAMLAAGTNRLDIRVRVAAPGHTMYAPIVGPESDLRPIYEQRRFWTHTTAQMTVIVVLVVGLFVLGILVRRRMAFEYGLFGIAAVCWGIRTASLVVAVYPAWLWHPWRIVHYAATGGFVIAMTLFMLRFARIRLPKIERLLIAYWPTGPLLLLAGGPAWETWTERYYQAGLIAASIAMFAATLVAGWRQRTLGALGLCGGVLFALALGVHDYLLSQQVIRNHHGFLLHLGANALLLAMGILLADRFVRSLGDAERSAEVLESKVRERERELAENYERLRRLERDRAAGEERQRIMQDMHDGLGSQLLTSLAMVERGALDREGMAQALREAIDDLRLAIDTLAPGREGFMESLANLAWRLAPRFSAAGMELRFHLDRAPESIDLHAGTALQLLRILQEALSNVLKHAQARKVDVEVAVADGPSRLELTVRDDGHGFDSTSSAPAGRGLGGMERRAQRIGATLRIASDGTGTRLSLALPLAQAPSPGG